MTKPSASLPVLYARVPVETYALAQLLAGNGKTSLSKWIADLIESQRGTLGGQPLSPYAQPVVPASREFTFAFDVAADLETREDAVRLADWILRTPDIRNKPLRMTLLEASHHAVGDDKTPQPLLRALRAIDLLQSLVIHCPNGTKATALEIPMNDELSPDARILFFIGQIAGEIWDENDHAWWEMVRTLPRLVAPEYWDALRTYNRECAMRESARAVRWLVSGAVAAEHEPGYAVAAVAPVKRGRGRPRKVQQLDREDGHQRAAEAACSSGDE